MATSAGYDPDAQEMHVEFPNGSVHIFQGVPPEKYLEVMGADSFGKAFNELIRRKHESRRHEVPTEGPAV